MQPEQTGTTMLPVFWLNSVIISSRRRGVCLHPHYIPVSYTHLDVYKRQQLSDAFKGYRKTYPKRQTDRLVDKCQMIYLQLRTRFVRPFKLKMRNKM